MDSLRLVEGKVKLELSRHIYNFMQAVSSYELLACEHDFRLTAPAVADGKFKLLRPFIDKSVPLSSIREFAWVIGVDSQMHALFIDLISMGSIKRTIVEPWQVFRGTFIAASTGIFFVHNHPSGDTTPSQSDLDLTRAIIQGGLYLDRPLLDHLIIGSDGYTSLADNKILYPMEDRVKEDRLGIEHLNTVIDQKNSIIHQKDDLLHKKDREIERLNALLANFKNEKDF